MMSSLSSLFVSSDQPSLLLFADFDSGLILVSLLVAVLTSTMALQVVFAARQAQHRRYRQIAVLSGSLTLGGGIWAMHFIGMLAFSICADATYSLSMTLLSILPSLFASWVALQVLTRDSVSWRQLISSGVLVGMGIGAMHYSGMAAMHMGTWLRYDPYWFAVSIVVAVILAITALWVRFSLAKSRLSPLRANLIGGLVLGCAISGMHYLGMFAARLVGEPAIGESMSSHAMFIAVLVGISTVLVTLLVAGFNGLLRYRELNSRLQTSEQHLRSLVQTAVDGIITVDRHGILRSVNPAVERLFGWTAEELVGQSLARVMPEGYAQRFSGYLEHYLATGESELIGREMEVVGLLRSGEQVPVRVSLGLMKDAGGQPLFVAFVADIGQRKEMERALRDSEQQYASLIRNIPGVSFRCLLDADWSMLFISEAVEALTGWRPEDFLARRVSFAALYHPDDLQLVADEVTAAVEHGRNYVVEYRILDREGREHWLWESGCGVRDEHGEVKWIDGVLLDVTETKLRNAEFEGTVNAINRVMAVIEFDMDGNIIEVNDNLLALSGYQRNELIGRHHAVLCEAQYVDSEAYAQFWARLRQGEYDSGEYCRLRRDGDYFWIQASYNPIFNADGKPFKVVKFATDISVRREMERDLREAKTRAEQAAASKTTFLANMSHEIRTPMNAIIGFADLLMSSPLSDQQRHHLDTVRQSSRSLLGLLNDILDTAKLERGAFELERNDFPLRQVLRQVVDSLSLAASNKGLNLELDYHPALAEHFRGDALRVRQIVTNLVGNAVKFTERGYVRVIAYPDHGNVHLLVRDTGIGIPADRLERIFDPFAQADATMSRRFGGTGLGTSIARQLVELMGGRIWVESELDVGSVFHVMLPLDVGQAAPREAASSSDVITLPPLRVLAVDDVPQNLELLQMILLAQGHQVVVAVDGEQALQAFAAESFDIVLMDVQMPKVDGLEATRRIRCLERERGQPPTPVVAVSASVLDEDRRLALEAGMDGFASKPLELPRLMREIARLLGKPVAVTSPQAVAETSEAVIDWAGGIALWGSEHALAEAIRRFLDEQAGCVAELRLLWRDGSREQAAARAHRVRGAAGNLSLTQVYQAASELEFSGRQGDDSAAELQLEALEAALAALPGSLAEHLPAAPAFGNVDRVPQQVQGMAEQLAASLRRGELDEAVLGEMEEILRGGPWHDAFAHFNQALQNFDLDQAAVLLDEYFVQLDSQRPREAQDV